MRLVGVAVPIALHFEKRAARDCPDSVEHTILQTSALLLIECKTVACELTVVQL